MRRLALLPAATVAVVTTMASADPPPLASAPAVSRFAMPANVAAAVQNVERFYQPVTALRTAFTETLVLSMFGNTTVWQGYVTAAKPMKSAWHFTAGGYAGNYSVSDGQVAGVYEAGTHAFFLEPASASYYGSLFSFMSGPGALSAQCNLTLYRGDQLQYPTGYVLLCLPKSPSAPYARMLYYVDGASSEVRRVVIRDANNNRRTFELDHAQINPTLSPTEFSLAPPPGARVVSNLPASPAAPAPAPSSSSSTTFITDDW